MSEAQAIQQLRLSDIMDDTELQSRESLNTVAIEEYASELRADDGLEFDPVVVYHDGKKHWLAHGFHRFRAYQHARRSSIPAEVREGTRREAILYSVGANARNGLRRTNADKRRAVSMLLRDPEWAGNTNEWIAEQCVVSAMTVGRIRAETDSHSNNVSATRVARTKHGTVTTMNTANIGRKPAAPAPVVPTGRSMTVEEYEAANGAGPSANATGHSPSVPLTVGDGRQAHGDDDAEREANLAEALRALITECERFPKYREVADAIRKSLQATE